MGTNAMTGNIDRECIVSVSLTPASVAEATTAEQTFTVKGLKVGMHVTVNPPGVQAGSGIAGARVSAADTLAITFINATITAVVPLAGVYTVCGSLLEDTQSVWMA